MTDIHQPLSRLGLSQYVERFVEEGFDTWQAILHITESDLDHLRVKRGHRRILQREIAFDRGVPIEQLSSPTHIHQPDDVQIASFQDGAKLDGQVENAPRGKRKYRRHAKHDENAPERPPSAYVLFSNKLREELKPRNLSFTDIAKRVGERWQSITADEKGIHEKLAMELKEKYNKEMSAYKLTDNYRNYMDYLADFKLKNPGSADGKKPRLEQEDSRDSNGSNDSHIVIDVSDHQYNGSTTGEPRRRVNSMSSSEPQQSTGGFPSPVGRQTGGHGTLGMTFPHNNISPLPTSPSSPSVRRDSSTGPVPATALLPRPSQEPSVDPVSYAGLNPRMRRSSPYGDGLSNRSSSLGPSMDQKLSRSHDNQSPMDDQRHTNRPVPRLIHQNTSSSSNLSLGSVTSVASTNASSMYSAARIVEENDRPQLPPLSATGLHKSSGNMADYALRPAQQPSVGTTIPTSHHMSYQSTYGGSPISSDIPPIASLRNVQLQQTPEQHRMNPISQMNEPRNSPLQPLEPVLPGLRSTLSRDDRPPSPDNGPGQDRLAFLADVAHADRDRRPGV